MLTPRFESLFSRLTWAFIRHDETPRDVDHLPDLAAARADLEDVRWEIALERRMILVGQAAAARPSLGADEEAVSRASMLNISTQR